MQGRLILAVFIIMFILFVPNLYAKRLPPPEVQPIFYNGIRYSPCGDSICAADEKTGKDLWEKQIYVVKYIPELETDVQWCFIKKMEMKDNKLIITNERGYEYELNLDTLEVTVLKGSLVIRRIKKNSSH